MTQVWIVVGLIAGFALAKYSGLGMDWASVLGG